MNRAENIRIYKYRLELRDVQSMLMPEGAEVLSVQVQNGSPCMWAKVDTITEERTWRQFVIYGTGHPTFDFPSKFIGTFQMDNGSLVFHVFELIGGAQ